MATIYSLVCWGGRTGKTVALSLGTPCVVTSTRHGVRDGTGVILSTTGVLPTGLLAGVTYYAKNIAVNTFGLYSDSALSVPVVASGTQSGTHTIKSEYFVNLTPTERLQYGDAGSERIYGGLTSFVAARGAPSSPLNDEVCHLGMAFTEDLSTSVLTLAFNAAQARITPINDAGYNGTDGSGYILLSNNTNYANPVLKLSTVVIVENFTVQTTGVGSGLQIPMSLASAYRMRVIGVVGASNFGISPVSQAVYVTCCVVSGFAKGLYINGTYFNQCVFSHNLLYGNTAGLSITTAVNLGGFFWNNISINNTTNWPATPTGIQGAGSNAGLSTDVPWATAGYSSVAVALTDFVDYSIGNYRPLTSGSPQVDAALPFYGQSSFDLDIAGNVRPNYNNGGAEAYDIGCYEFDHGFGPHPASHVLTLTNVVTGSRVHVSDQAGAVVHYDDIAAASTVVITQTVYGDARDSWRVKVRKASDSPTYQPYETLMTATAGSSSLYIAQIQDE